MKTSASVSHSWSPILESTHNVHIFTAFTNEEMNSWELGSAGPPWVAGSESRSGCLQPPEPAVLWATPKLDSSIPGGTFRCVIPGFCRCPREGVESTVDPGKCKLRPWGCPVRSTVGTPAHDPSRSACRRCPWPGQRKVEARAVLSPFLSRSWCSPNSLYQVPWRCSARHLLTNCSHPLLPAGAEPGWGNRWRVGVVQTLESLRHLLPVRGAGHWTVCAGDHVWFVSSFLWEGAGATDLPSLCSSDICVLVATAHWRQAWWRQREKWRQACEVAVKCGDVKREWRQRTTGWRRLGVRVLEEQLWYQSKHLSFPGGCFCLTFAWIYWMSFKHEKPFVEYLYKSCWKCEIKTLFAQEAGFS